MSICSTYLGTLVSYDSIRNVPIPNLDRAGPCISTFFNFDSQQAIHLMVRFLTAVIVN